MRIQTCIALDHVTQYTKLYQIDLHTCITYTNIRFIALHTCMNALHAYIHTLHHIHTTRNTTTPHIPYMHRTHTYKRALLTSSLYMNAYVHTYIHTINTCNACIHCVPANLAHIHSCMHANMRANTTNITHIYIRANIRYMVYIHTIIHA